MQYRSLKREINMLEDQIAAAGGGNDLVADYAKNYSTGYPRVVTLRGYGVDDVPNLVARLERCMSERKAIEDFVAGLDDSMMRQLLTRRYLEARPIQETAELMGYSERQAGRLINGFFRKHVL